MIERIAEMPAGTVGLRAAGKVSAEDYRSVLEPTLGQAAEAGEIRVLYLLENDVEMSLGAIAQDAKTGLRVGLGHHSAWKRSAVVTDVEWIEDALLVFAWMVPGDLRLFPVSEIEDAKSWISERA